MNVEKYRSILDELNDIDIEFLIVDLYYYKMLIYLCILISKLEELNGFEKKSIENVVNMVS